MACLCAGAGFYRVTRRTENGPVIVNRACECDAGFDWAFEQSKKPASAPPRHVVRRRRARCFADYRTPIGPRPSLANIWRRE